MTTFTSISAACAARQIEWGFDSDKVTLSFRGNELAGETGEACNIIKKLERERMGLPGSRATIKGLADELADIVICAYNTAWQAGIDLDLAIPSKFNATSEQVGLETRLALPDRGAWEKTWEPAPVTASQNEPPPVNRDDVTLTDGSPVTPDYRELREDWQQKGYVVLSAEERAKGFVRPVRRSYEHVGRPGPKNPLRDLTDDERGRQARFGYVKYEEYPESERHCSSVIGRYWSQVDLDSINNGCRAITHMGGALAETYARDPKFYGATFCCGCRKHLPVEEFVWAGTDERMGS